MIQISPRLEAQIRAEAQKAYPDECCGIMLGAVHADGKTVTGIVPVANARESEERYHRFQIDAETLMQAEKAARAQKLDVVGFYHSHPDHPAKPSDFDKEHALPFYSYIIVESVQNGTAAFTVWELTADRTQFLPEKMQIED